MKKDYQVLITIRADCGLNEEDMLLRLRKVFSLAGLSFPIKELSFPKAKRTKAVPKNYTEEFLEFWALYHPKRKSSKRKAFEAWVRSGIDASELLGLSSAALKWQSLTPAWREDNGQYFPLASSWLNGRRWEDENPNKERRTETYMDMDGVMRERVVDVD